MRWSSYPSVATSRVACIQNLVQTESIGSTHFKIAKRAVRARLSQDPISLGISSLISGTSSCRQNTGCKNAREAKGMPNRYASILSFDQLPPARENHRAIRTLACKSIAAESFRSLKSSIGCKRPTLGLKRPFPTRFRNRSKVISMRRVTITTFCVRSTSCQPTQAKLFQLSELAKTRA